MKKISQQRKTAYSVGMVLIVLGIILFVSNFFTIASGFGNFDNFSNRMSRMVMMGIGGMALIVIGSIIRTIGARGMAGSGVVLNPEQAREDLEPYTRMAGGMAKDFIDESGIKIGGGQPEKVIMLKCRGCGQLNEEGSKFCQECGAHI